MCNFSGPGSVLSCASTVLYKLYNATTFFSAATHKLSQPYAALQCHLCASHVPVTSWLECVSEQRGSDLDAERPVFWLKEPWTNCTSMVHVPDEAANVRMASSTFGSGQGAAVFAAHLSVLNKSYNGQRRMDAHEAACEEQPLTCACPARPFWPTALQCAPGRPQCRPQWRHPQWWRMSLWQSGTCTQAPSWAWIWRNPPTKYIYSTQSIWLRCCTRSRHTDVWRRTNSKP